MSIEQSAFEVLTGDEADSRAEPHNFLTHATALSLTKSADGLIDPKLVLSWLLSSLSVPSFFIGLLVPIREAGALLPQMFTAPFIQSMTRRKWAWVGAAAGQGAGVAAILIAALFLEGWALGLVACCALAVLALSRSVASVSYKDILGRTVSAGRRGTATGLASSTSAVVVIIFALMLMWAPVNRFALVIGALGLAVLAFGTAALIFAGLREEADTGTEPGSIRAALSQFRVLREDANLRWFVAARGLLTATALAPPFLVMLAADAGNEAFQRLGALVLASAIASFLSSYVWGRLSDRSSRRVLILTGFGGGAALMLAVALDLAGLTGTIWALPVTLFLLMIAYHGVRQGRSTYLVDIAPEDQRTGYAAVANTVIGVILLGAGVFGALASVAGPVVTIALFAAMSIGGGLVALKLSEAE